MVKALARKEGLGECGPWRRAGHRANSVAEAPPPRRSRLPIALGVNALTVILAFVASIQTVMAPEDRLIIVTIVPPFDFQRTKPVPPKTAPQTTQTARVHAAAPSAASKPSARASAGAAVTPGQAPRTAPPPGRWTPTPDLHSQFDDQPSALRYMRAGAACAKGELWKLSREEQDKCLTRLGSKVPPDDGMHHHPPPNDPGGEFARARSQPGKSRRDRCKARRMGQCPVGTEGSNLHRVCHSDEKGSLVQRLEGQH